MSLKIGDHIPPVILNNQFGEIYNIDNFLGKKNLVIFFYPKDETPGCTAEACAFRDAYEDFAAYGCEIIGISSDDEESHRNFAIKYRLTYTLLSDPGDRVRTKFKVPSSLFGIIPGRVTYIVDKNGIIVDIYNSQLQISKHISKSLETLKKLNQ